MEIWSGNSEGLLDIYADPELIVEYTHFEKIEGIAQYKKFLQTTYQSFDQLEIHINEVVSNKKKESVIVFWNYTGIHRNHPIFGVQPSGKKVAVNGITFLQFQNNKVVHEKGMIDNLSLLMQLNSE